MPYPKGKKNPVHSIRMKNLWQDSLFKEKDGNIHNNSFGNLCVMTRGDHTRFHISG